MARGVARDVARGEGGKGQSATGAGRRVPCASQSPPPPPAPRRCLTPPAPAQPTSQVDRHPAAMHAADPTCMAPGSPSSCSSCFSFSPSRPRPPPRHSSASFPSPSSAPVLRWRTCGPERWGHSALPTSSLRQATWEAAHEGVLGRGCLRIALRSRFGHISRGSCQSNPSAQPQGVPKVASVAGGPQECWRTGRQAGRVTRNASYWCGSGARQMCPVIIQHTHTHMP